MTPRFLLVVFIFLTWTSAARAQVPAEKALTELKVSPGLEVSLWASEPMFCNPTCMDIDHKGRIWVVESINYRNQLRKIPLKRPAGDRILVMEDSKGSGKADKVTVFYQSPDMLAPLGIFVAPYPDGPGCKVFVCQSPHIQVFEDKDGDCKADGPPTVFLTGFKGIDHDHGVHGIFIGPDNKLYFSVGDQGVNNLKSSDGKGRSFTSNNTDVRAGTIWRCELDGKNVELLAHNFRNEYEHCMDSFGSMFLSDNDDDGRDQTRICFIMPGGNYGYHPRGKGQTHWHDELPGVVPGIVRTFRGSPTGICMYEGTLLPEKYWGQPLHTDAGPGRLTCYHLTPNGAGYKVDREDMITSPDRWFRPSDVCVAPDGSVFISDWYDPGVGGHGIRDFANGRIYRVVPKGHQGYKIPPMDLKSEKGLRAALGSPNLSMRSAAQAKISALLASNKVEDRAFVRETLLAPGLDLLFDNGKHAADYQNAVLRARALWHILEMPRGPMALKDAESEKGDDRFRVLAHRIKYDQRPDSWEEMAKLAMKDASPAVRREALLQLRHKDPLKAKPYIFDLAKQYDGKDRFYLEAVGIAVGHLDQKRREILLGDIEKQLPEWTDKTVGLVWELQPPGLIPRIANSLTDPKLPTRQRTLFVDFLTTSPDLATGSALMKALAQQPPLELRERLLDALKVRNAANWNALKKSEDFQAALKYLKAKSDTHGDALALIMAAKHDGETGWISSVMEDAKQPLAIRLAAIRTLGTSGVSSSTKQIAALLEKNPPDELAIEAILILGRDDAMSAGIKQMAASKDKPLSWRQAAVAGLASKIDHSKWLLQEEKDKKLPADLGPDLARLLRNSPFPEVKKQATTILPAPPALDPKNLPSIPALLARKGSIERGKNVMLATLKNEAQCLKCHSVQGIGGNVGPDLTTIGAKAGRETLLESILYPSRAISHQYETWIVETKAGLVVTGVAAEEATDHLILRDASTREFKIANNEIESRVKSPVSIMPDNSIMYITEGELLDLVEYLASLRGSIFSTDQK